MASPEMETSRRAFLRRGAPAALGALVRDVAGRDAETDRAASGDLLRLGRRAMGCRFEIMLPAAPQAPVEAAREALDLVDALERQMTVYSEESEISRINRTAAAGPVPVEPRLFDLLRTAERLSAETGGAFDITAALPPAGMGRVRLEEAERTIAFDREGVRLDLAAIGKGHALDRAAGLLAARGVWSALVHGGHSSVRAIGRPPWDDAWTVRVQHPLQPDRAVAVLRLRDRAMGTSAAGAAQGRHLLDPRTGRPSEGPVGATVVAPTAAEADALSTACCVMSVEETRAYCGRRPELGALLVETTDGETRASAIGLSADEVEVIR